MNKEQNSLGPNFRDEVYNSMWNIFAKDQNAYVQ